MISRWKYTGSRPTGPTETDISRRWQKLTPMFAQTTRFGFFLWNVADFLRSASLRRTFATGSLRARITCVGVGFCPHSNQPNFKNCAPQGVEELVLSFPPLSLNLFFLSLLSLSQLVLSFPPLSLNLFFLSLLSLSQLVLSFPLSLSLSLPLSETYRARSTCVGAGRAPCRASGDPTWGGWRHRPWRAAARWYPGPSWTRWVWRGAGGAGSSTSAPRLPAKTEKNLVLFFETRTNAGNVFCQLSTKMRQRLVRAATCAWVDWSGSKRTREKGQRRTRRVGGGSYAVYDKDDNDDSIMTETNIYKPLCETAHGLESENSWKHFSSFS